MGEELKKFLEGVGALTELWTVIYNNFRRQGMARHEAAEHTQMMVQTILKMGMDKM
jgi:hypothetical protein